MEEWEQHLPTAEVVHKEIVLPLEYIAGAFQCSRNTLDKRLNEMPKRKPVTKEQDIIDILDLYESALDDYKREQFKSGTEAEKRWKQEKPKYRAALEKELAQNKELLAYKREFEPKLSEYQRNNRKVLLSSIEEVYKNLTPQQAIKFAYYYDGYEGLFNAPNCRIDLILLGISLMTPEAKRNVKNIVDNMENTVKRLGPWILYNGEAIAQCKAIRYKDMSELRKGPGSAWNIFQKKCASSEYWKFLGVAALVRIFTERDIDNDALDILINCAFLLDQSQQEALLSTIQKNLIPPNIQPKFSMADAEQILKLSKRENIMIRLERYLGIESEEELGIYECENPGDE